MNIYKLTQEQKDSLINIDNLIFNPIQDFNDDWIISENEYYYILGLWYIDECPNELVFIKDLISEVYEPKINLNPFGV